MKKTHHSEPHHYNLADHVRKIAEGPDFRAHAAVLSVTPEVLIVKLADEVKRVIGENRAKGLADFEQHFGIRALSELVEKLKADKAA
jgi:hypothetical protein